MLAQSSSLACAPKMAAAVLLLLLAAPASARVVERKTQGLANLPQLITLLDAPTILKLNLSPLLFLDIFTKTPGGSTLTSSKDPIKSLTTALTNLSLTDLLSNLNLAKLLDLQLGLATPQALVDLDATLLDTIVIDLQVLQTPLGALTTLLTETRDGKTRKLVALPQIGDVLAVVDATFKKNALAQRLFTQAIESLQIVPAV